MKADIAIAVFFFALCALIGGSDLWVAAHYGQAARKALTFWVLGGLYVSAAVICAFKGGWKFDASDGC